MQGTEAIEVVPRRSKCLFIRDISVYAHLSASFKDSSIQTTAQITIIITEYADSICVAVRVHAKDVLNPEEAPALAAY